MPRHSGLSAPAYRGFSRLQFPGDDSRPGPSAAGAARAPSPGAALSAEMEREIRVLWPNLAPAVSVPFDLRNMLLACGAGQTVVYNYRMPAGSEGPIKEYGFGLWPTSLVPAPAVVWFVEMRVNGAVVTPQEGAAGWFPIASPNPTDANLTKLTVPLTGNDVVTFVLTNLTGILLDVWIRCKGWRYQSRAVGGV